MNPQNRNFFKKFLIIPVIFGIFTAFITYLRHDSGASFISQWLPLYMVGLSILVPLTFVAIKGIVHIMTHYVHINNVYLKGAVSGLFMAMTIALIGSMAVILIQHELNPSDSFSNHWAYAEQSCLPVMLLVGPVMGSLVSPLAFKRK